MRIAVVGGSGFIGGVLVPLLLEAGHQVRIVDIASPSGSATAAEYVRADVTDADAMVEALRGTDSIVNLAAVHRDDVRPISLYDDVNVGGAANICKAASTLKIPRILFTSSVAVYGFQDGEPDETRAPQPFNDYGRTKAEAEVCYRAWRDAAPDERSLVIVRPTVVFGQGNRGNVYNLMNQLSRSRFIMVGDGLNRKSMAYVGNIAAFLAHLATSAAPGDMRVYNYCDKPDFDMNELARYIRTTLNLNPSPLLCLPYAMGVAAGAVFDGLAALSGRTFPVSRIRIRKFCSSTIFAATKLEETGFKRPFEFSEALCDVVRSEFSPASEGTRASS